jgi:hypothetical protein
MSESQSLKDRRIGDPHLDRRSGDDRREHDGLDFFVQGGVERRSIEPRQKGERRAQCIKVSQWSSVCSKINVSFCSAPLPSQERVDILFYVGS